MTLLAGTSKYKIEMEDFDGWDKSLKRQLMSHSNQIKVPINTRKSFDTGMYSSMEDG